MSVKSRSKQILLAGARRLGVNAILRKASRGRLLVLCYHGVISEDHPEDPHRASKAVTIREFREQLSIVCGVCRPVSATDVLEWLENSRALPDNAVLYTFDDGFRNNLTCAAPELDRHGIPAIVHVTTGHIGDNRLLWTHEIDERILHWKHATLPMPGERSEIGMPSAATKRAQVAERVRELCKSLPDTDRESYLDLLRNEPLPGGEAWHKELYQFLSWDDVRELTHKGISIGSHTVEHRVLSRLSRNELVRELRDSKATIEREIGQQCHWIAYPNGGPNDYTPEVTSMAADAGYRVGFTLMNRLNAACPVPLEVDRMCISGGLSQQNDIHARISGLQRLIDAVQGRRA